MFEAHLNFESLQLLAQLNPQAMAFIKLAIWAAATLVLLLIGAATFKKLQTKWREEEAIGRGSGLFDMDELRSLRDQGKLTEEEFEKAMNATANKKKQILEAALATEKARREKELRKGKKNVNKMAEAELEKVEEQKLENANRSVNDSAAQDAADATEDHVELGEELIPKQDEAPPKSD